MPKFSVIIPCYNASSVFRRGLEALDNQSYKDFEVVIVDDCSTDNSVDIIKACQDEFSITVRLLRNERNSGPGISRNNGIKAAQGEYLCFLDADDYFDSTYFECLSKQIEDTGSDVVFFSNFHIVGKQQRIMPAYNYSKKEYVALSPGALWKFCSSRLLWEGIEMPSQKNAEDIAVIPVILSRARNITSISNSLYYYIHSNNSLSSTHKPEVSYSFIKSFEYTEKMIDVVKYHDEIEFHGIKTILYGATLNALKAGISNREIKNIWNTFTQKYPQWYSNKYISAYPKNKRFFLFLVKSGQVSILRFYSRIHSTLLQLLG